MNDAIICSVLTKHPSLIFGGLCFITILATVLFENTIEISSQNTFFIFVVFTVVAMALLSLIIANHHKSYFDLTDGLIAILLLYVAYRNDYSSPTISHFINIKFLFVLYFGLRILIKGIKGKIVSLILIASLSFLGIIECLIGILQLIGVCTSNHTIFPITGTFFNPGPYGGYLAIIGSITLSFSLKNYPKIKKTFTISRQDKLLKSHKMYIGTYLIAIIASIFILIILPFTESRGALLAIIVPILIFLWKNNYIQVFFKKNRTVKIICTVVLIVSCLFFFYNLKRDSANARLHIWGISLVTLENASLLGSGIGSFQNSYAVAQEEYFNREHDDSKKVKYADSPEYAFNEYLEITSEIGVIGLIIILLVILLIIRQLLNENNVFIYGLISILCFATVSYPLHILPIQILLVTFLATRGFQNYKQSHSYYKSLSTVFLFFLFTFWASKDVGNYLNKIEATNIWINERMETDASIVDIHNIDLYNNQLYPCLNDNPRFLLDYGMVLKNNKLYNRSIDVLLEGSCMSSNPTFFVLIGDDYKALNDYAQAEYYYKKAFVRVPNRLYPLYALATLYYETKQFDKFSELYLSLKSFTPKITSKTTDDLFRDIDNMYDILQEDFPGFLICN